jgi:hypothetical protein
VGRWGRERRGGIMESRGEWNLFRFQGLRPETEINFLSFFSPISVGAFFLRLDFLVREKEYG